MPPRNCRAANGMFRNSEHIGAGFVSMGIPKNSVVEYELALKTDQFLLLVNGSTAKVEKARGILAATNAVNTVVHCCEAVGAGER